MGMGPIIDVNKCQGCGLCVSVCPRGGLIIIDRIVNFVETVECDYGATCESVCPNSAIRCPFEIVLERNCKP